MKILQCFRLPTSAEQANKAQKRQVSVMREKRKKGIRGIKKPGLIRAGETGVPGTLSHSVSLRAFLGTGVCVRQETRRVLPSYRASVHPPVIRDHTGAKYPALQAREQTNKRNPAQNRGRKPSRACWTSAKRVIGWATQENKPWHRESPLKYSTPFMGPFAFHNRKAGLKEGKKPHINKCINVHMNKTYQ